MLNIGAETVSGSIMTSSVAEVSGAAMMSGAAEVSGAMVRSSTAIHSGVRTVSSTGTVLHANIVTSAGLAIVVTPLSLVKPSEMGSVPRHHHWLAQDLPLWGSFL